MTEKLILQELCRYNIGTYADIIYRNALLYPDYVAFSYQEETVTFRQFNERVNRLIHALESLGVKKGEVLGILSWNCLEYADVYGAAMKGGFIASPFNPRLGADELEYLVNYSEAKTLFVGPELIEKVNELRSRFPNVKDYVSFERGGPKMIAHRDLLRAHPKGEPDVEVTEDDPFLIFYTSGTTGVPRGALYTQGRKMADTRIFVHELAPDPGDKHVMIVPLFHVAGGSILWAFFYAAAGNVKRGRSRSPSMRSRLLSSGFLYPP